MRRQLALGLGVKGRPPYTPLGFRFWSKVSSPDAGGHREWRAARNSDGYGHFSASIRGEKRQKGAHVWAWILTNGPVPPGLVVRHGPGCPRTCCEPSHLSLGTPGDNAADRMAFGAGVGRRTPPDVLARAVSRVLAGEAQHRVAAELGVSRPGLRSAVNRALVERSLQPDPLAWMAAEGGGR